MQELNILHKNRTTSHFLSFGKCDLLSKEKMDTKTKIILTRPSQWMNRIRGYKVLINGQQVGVIKNGATEEYLVEPGTNSVECKVSWCSSRTLPVNIQSGETTYLKVSNGMKLYYLMVLLLAGEVFLNFYYRGNPDKPSWFEPVTMGLIIIVFAYLLYYLTFGRKDYLLLEKDTKNVFA